MRRWTPDRREGKLWRWREGGRAPDVTSATTTPQGPAGHGNLTCLLPKTPSHTPPILLEEHFYWPGVCSAWPRSAFLPPFFPTSIRLSLTFGPESLSFPSRLSSLLFQCAFTLANPANEQKYLHFTELSVQNPPLKKKTTRKTTKAWQMCNLTWRNSESVQLVSVVTHYQIHSKSYFSNTDTVNSQLPHSYCLADSLLKLHEWTIYMNTFLASSKNR